MWRWHQMTRRQAHDGKNCLLALRAPAWCSCSLSEERGRIPVGGVPRTSEIETPQAIGAHMFRSFGLSTALTAAMLACLALVPGAGPVAPATAAEKTVQMLFVQSAEGVEFGDGKMTMKSVSPATVFFSDRP